MSEFNVGDRAVLLAGKNAAGLAMYPPRIYSNWRVQYHVAIDGNPCRAEYPPVENCYFPVTISAKDINTLIAYYVTGEYELDGHPNSFGFWVGEQHLERPSEHKLNMAIEYISNEVLPLYTVAQVIWTLKHPLLNPYLTLACMEMIVDDPYYFTEAEVEQIVTVLESGEYKRDAAPDTVYQRAYAAILYVHDEVNERYICDDCGGDLRVGRHQVIYPGAYNEPPDYYCERDDAPDEEELPF